ncbi:hypothetical protein BHE74_00019329 [Ensete ventricosum]|nr:hypothetical protein BHE74_00019329 [Ensete ventricosum]
MVSDREFKIKKEARNRYQRNPEKKKKDDTREIWVPRTGDHRGRDRREWDVTTGGQVGTVAPRPCRVVLTLSVLPKVKVDPRHPPSPCELWQLYQFPANSVIYGDNVTHDVPIKHLIDVTSKNWMVKLPDMLSKRQVDCLRGTTRFTTLGVGRRGSSVSISGKSLPTESPNLGVKTLTNFLHLLI